MTPERWQQIKGVLHGALELKPQQRSGFLAKACADDPALRQEVESLLALDDQERFTPMIGKTIAHYRIVGELGSGGMGVVYKAEDLKLQRHVALKFLPEGLVGDSTALQRFQREARAASALNHPNICTIYEVEEHETQPVIVMELLEGESLKDRIRKGPVPMSELLEFGIQSSEALEAAHAKRIIHRDIKPGNMFIVDERRVKILDFGLAKVISSHLPEDELGDETLTIQGFTPGTTAYMSPEQIRGEEIDTRSDLFSLGVVLYEMATSKKPFVGKNRVLLMNAILNSQPVAPSRVNDALPASFDTIIAKSLEKDRERRYQHASETATALRMLKRDMESARLPVTEKSERQPNAEKHWKLIAAACFVLITLALAFAAMLWVHGSGKISDRSTWLQLTNFPDSVSQPALSPDGRMLVFVRGQDTFAGPGQIYVKILPEGEPVQLTRDSLQKMSPVFSPDGSKIAYTTSTGAKWDTWVVPVLSGHPELWLPNASGLTWSKQGKILFSEIKDNRVHMAIEAAEESRAGERDIYVPAGILGMAHRTYPSPDGKWTLVVEHAPGFVWLPCRLVRTDGSFSDRQVGPQNAGCTAAGWSPDGKWMYLNSSVGGTYHIWRQRFPNGHIEQITSGPSEEEGIAMASDGRSLITAVGLRQSSVWIHEPTGEKQVSVEGYSYDPRFTPDGKKLCYQILKGVSPASDAGELRVLELASGRNESLLPGFSVVGRWAYDISPDGQRVVVSALDRDGKRRLWLASLDRHLPPRQIADLEGWKPMFGADGEIIFRVLEGPSFFVYSIREDGSGLKRIINEPDVIPRAISRDGQWLMAAGIGVSAIAFPLQGGSPVPILRASVPLGDPYVRWSRDGKYFIISLPTAPLLNDGRTYAIPLMPGQTFPKIPPGGFQSEAEIAKVPGARRIDAYDVAFGPNQEVYAFARETVQRNLYRIPIP
jgi:serine/threonine protein kinase